MSLSILETLEVFGGSFGPAGTIPDLIAGGIAFGAVLALVDHGNHCRGSGKGDFAFTVEGANRRNFDLHGVDGGGREGEREGDKREHFRAF